MLAGMKGIRVQSHVEAAGVENNMQSDLSNLPHQRKIPRPSLFVRMQCPKAAIDDLYVIWNKFAENDIEVGPLYAWGKKYTQG